MSGVEILYAGDTGGSGDEAPAGTPDTGENICRACRGTGRQNDAPCPACSGTGKVVEGVGGA